MLIGKKGIIYICIATFSFAWMNITAKQLIGFHPMQVVFFRAIGTWVFIFPFMLLTKVDILGTERKLLLFRAVIGFLSLALFFWAVQRIPLGSAISIRYVSPIFASVLAIKYLGEKVNIYQWIAFITAIVGTLLLKGLDVRIDFLSFFMVLISAFFVGIVFVLIRHLTQKEHFLTIINYFMMVCILGSLFFIQSFRLPIGAEWYPVISIGIFGLIGQIFMTLAFKYEEASTLAPFKYMELIYAMIIGYFIFEEQYTISVLLAMGLIIVGMVGNVFAKNITNKSN